MSILDELDKPKKRKVGLTYNEKEHRFVITFDPDITKDEFMVEWKRFDTARKKMAGKSRFTKSRPPKDIQLVLGVKFFRSFGIPFKVIHNEYSKGRVKSYSGSYEYDTEFELQKYYNRNKHKIKDT